MIIEALTFTPANFNNSKTENVVYASAKVTARTLLKALRQIEEAVGTKRMSYSPAVRINNEVFYTQHIHNFCHGCHSVKDAENFLKHNVKFN